MFGAILASPPRPQVHRRLLGADYPAANAPSLIGVPVAARARPPPSAGAPMTPFYVAGACLVLAQVLGIYGLITRKADLTFALVMLVLVVVAIAAGVDGVYTNIG